MMDEDSLAPNPRKPWLMKWEGDIEHAGIEVPTYEVSEDKRTNTPPRDPYLRNVLNICECGHTGGDHRPYCIVIECGCERMRETKEWEIKELESRHLFHLATMAGKKIEEAS